VRYVSWPVADWVRDQLSAPYSGVTAIVPAGFEAYVRVFHPAESNHGGDPPLRWAAIAAGHGRVMHAGAQFHAIATPAGQRVVHDPNQLYGPVVRADGRPAVPPREVRARSYQPRMGSLPEAEFTAVVDVLSAFTATPRETVCCLWEGFGGMPGQKVGRIDLPLRRYVVVQGDLGAGGHRWWECAVSMHQLYQSPNLAWPVDRVWCVATEIDLLATLIGCSAAAAAALVAHPALEAWPIEPDASIGLHGDTENV